MGAAVSAGEPGHSSPGHFHQLFQEHPEVFQSRPRNIIPPACPLGLFPDGHTWNTSPRRHPGGILARCPNYLHWLLLMRGSSSSTLHLSWVSMLISLYQESHCSFSHFSHYPQLMAICEGWNVDILVNSVFRLMAPLPLRLLFSLF